jgi:hypothetical protein
MPRCNLAITGRLVADVFDGEVVLELSAGHGLTVRWGLSVWWLPVHVCMEVVSVVTIPGVDVC